MHKILCGIGVLLVHSGFGAALAHDTGQPHTHAPCFLLQAQHGPTHRPILLAHRGAARHTHGAKARVRAHVRKEIKREVKAHRRWCDVHPAQCAKRRGARHTWCERHPVTCRKIRSERRTWCQAHPVECALKRSNDPEFDLDLESDAP